MPARRKTFSWPPAKPGCYEYQGRRNPAGYGIANLVCVDGKSRPISVARWVLEMTMGRRLDTSCELTRHTCDNPPCFRRDHLLVGSPADNMHDMIERGRQRIVPQRGEASGRAKMSEDDVRMIRSSELSVAKLANQLGVSGRTVWLARVGLTWSHVT